MFKLQIKYLSFFFGIVSILSFFNILYSYYFNLYLNLDTYYFTLLASSILFITFFKFGKYDIKSNIFQRILTIFLGYLLIPLVLSIPFYFSIYNLTFSNSFFEAISGFTSTGFTVFENIKLIDQSLIIWRSSTQWIGGLYFLFSIIYLIDIYDDSFKKTLTNFISFNSSEILKQAAKIFILYISLTILIFIILNIFSIRSFDSLNLAFTLISSGGFLPVNDLSNIIKENPQIIILSFCMLTSFFSIFFGYNFIFFKDRNINFFYEDLHLIIYFIIILSFFFLFFSYDNDFLLSLLSVSSSISNIGFSVSEENNVIAVNTSGSSHITASLKAASSYEAGARLVFKDIAGSASSNNIVIEPSGSQKIDGSNTGIKIQANYGLKTFMFLSSLAEETISENTEPLEE